MRSLVEVCAEQRAENWRAWAVVKDVQRERSITGRRNRLGARRPQPPVFNPNPRVSQLRERALELYQSGMSSPEVGRELRVKPNTVKAWVKKAGIRGGAKHRKARAG